jgi:3-deoxy-D-manno-octulosonic-acid transferase
MLMRLFYSLLLVLVSPFFLYSLYKKKPGKPTIGKRWKEHFGFTPALANTSTPPIWIHAVSVGEVIAASPLIRALKSQQPEQIIVLTTTTSTGAQQAEKLNKLVEHRYMPLDFNFSVKAFIKRINPTQLIIMETELWPNTLYQATKAGITTTVINARLSDRSVKRYAKFPSIFKLLAGNINQVLCQHESDAARFIQLGIAANKVAVTGSIKFDINITKQIKQQGNRLREQLGISRHIWIAASTHPGEDEQILSSHQHLLTLLPNSLLLLVPRHPERFNDVYMLCKKSGMQTTRRTQKKANLSTTHIYLADTMGEMLTLLAASDICFMGGSLIGDKVGGHNLLEPAALGLPSLTGPSFYNFTDITQQLCDAGATTVIADNKQLAGALFELFNNPELIQQKSQAAKNVVKQNQGAIGKTLSILTQ